MPVGHTAHIIANIPCARRSILAPHPMDVESGPTTSAAIAKAVSDFSKPSDPAFEIERLEFDVEMATLTREQLKSKLKVEKGKNAELQKKLEALETTNKTLEEDASYQHDLYNKKCAQNIETHNKDIKSITEALREKETLLQKATTEFQYQNEQINGMITNILKDLREVDQANS